jgi:hypothetical protein
MLFAPFFHDDAPQGFSRSPKSSPDNQSGPNFLMSKITIPKGEQFLSCCLIFAIKLEQSETMISSEKLTSRKGKKAHSA